MKDLQIQTNCFNLKYTLECGQCFRWQKFGDYYIQILSDRVVKLKQNGSILTISSNKSENLQDTIINYFDLNTDYNKIESQISKIDTNISKAVKNTSGLRILNQDFFETVISYIISANNNIPRISKSINRISEKFGEKVFFENKTFHLFPKPKQLQKATIKDLQDCGTGYRAPYIIDTVNKFCEGKINIQGIHETNTLRKTLLSLKGVGPKVADCILLFSLQKKESFPIDTRVQKVMNELYVKSTISKNIKKEIQTYVQDNFGEYAGLIQEHLFFNKRMGRI